MATQGQASRDANRVTTLIGVSKVDFTTPEAVAVNPTNGALEVEGFISSSDAVSTGNSTTTPLSGNATFTGTGVDTLGYTSVSVYVYADQSSAANGVKIEFSSDNTNWNDATVDTFTSGNAAPNDGQTYIATCRARYVRVVYTNGSSAQGTFRLNTVLREGTLSGDVIPVADVPSALADHATLVKAAIMGKTTAGGGAWVDVKVNPSGALTVAATAGDATGSAVPANAFYQGVSDGTNLVGLRTPTTFKTVTATASGDNAVWTPTTGKKFRLMKYMIEVTGDCAISGGGVEVDIVWRDGTSPIGLGFSLWVPTISSTSTPGAFGVGWVDLGNGFLSAAANNVLNINLSATLTSGKCRVVAIGCEE